MAKSSRGLRGRRGDVMEMWQAPKQSLPAQIVGVLIRWRAELVVTAALTVYMVWLNGQTSDQVVITAAVFGPLVVVMLVGPTRRFVLSRFWCVVDRHRIRTCLRNARYRTMTLDGALPFMLWARPSKTGERIWVWTRAGSSGDDLESVLGYIAPACYAREARLHRTKMSTLVAVDVVRRDPLGKPKPVDSPLARLSAMAQGSATVPEGTEPITAATVTAIPVQDRRHAPARAAGDAAPASSSRKNGTPPNAAKPAVIVGGEDLSDYIDV